MGIASQVLEHLGGGSEWGLGIDHPLGLAQAVTPALPGAIHDERSGDASEVKLALAPRLVEQREELAAVEPGQDPYREEESIARGDPALAVAGQAPSGDHAMHVRMVQQGLCPGVQDGE